MASIDLAGGDNSPEKLESLLGDLHSNVAGACDLRRKGAPAFGINIINERSPTNFRQREPTGLNFLVQVSRRDMFLRGEFLDWHTHMRGSHANG